MVIETRPFALALVIVNHIDMELALVDHSNELRQLYPRTPGFLPIFVVYVAMDE